MTRSSLLSYRVTQRAVVCYETWSLRVRASLSKWWFSLSIFDDLTWIFSLSNFISISWRKVMSLLFLSHYLSHIIIAISLILMFSVTIQKCSFLISFLPLYWTFVTLCLFSIVLWMSCNGSHKWAYLIYSLLMIRIFIIIADSTCWLSVII